MGDKGKQQPRQSGAAGNFQEKVIRDSEKKPTPPPKPKK